MFSFFTYYPEAVCDVEPESFEFSVFFDDVITDTLFITNSGNIDLTYTIDWTADWLDVIPDEGSIPPESQESIQVTCIATDLLPDTYQPTEIADYKEFNTCQLKCHLDQFLCLQLIFCGKTQSV